MKSIVIWLFLAHIFAISTNGQKKDIDTSTFGNWPSLSGGAISNNGLYFTYNIDNQPIGKNTIIIESLDGKWNYRTSGSSFSNVKFTTNSGSAVFLLNEDTLCVIRLGGSNHKFISGVQSFTQPLAGMKERIAYISKNKNLVITELHSGKTNSISQVTDFKFDSTGSMVVFKRKNDQSEKEELSIINLKTGHQKKIIESFTIKSLRFYSDLKKIAFITSDGNGLHNNQTIYMYQTDSNLVHPLFCDSVYRVRANLKVEDITEFSPNGRRLFFQMTEGLKHRPALNEEFILTLWSYSDKMLQSEQLNRTNDSKTHSFVLDLTNTKILQLEYEFERCINKTDNYALICSKMANIGIGEGIWNKFGKLSFVLLDLTNGSRSLVVDSIYDYPTIDPSGRYVIYFDCNQQQYFSYNILSKRKYKITSNNSTLWTVDDDKPLSKFINYPVVGWLRSDSTRVILQDRYDLWLADMTGIHPTIAVTRGLGARNRVQFKISLPLHNGRIYEDKNILSVFNKVNKYNGFYAINFKANRDPVKLYMGPSIFNILENQYVPNYASFAPIKAKSSNVYLVKQMSASKSANFFTTSDFRKFKQLTFFYPEREFNWLTTELLSWKNFDGNDVQGVLYKPENFDSLKKYPIIFNYYETKSDCLNLYLKPQFAEGVINIPWYISRGYLVFTPDIHFKTGYPGESIVSNVISAAYFISKKRFIDSTKMGIQGHSLGGYETNFLVSHSNIFSAACSASGISDFVSGYSSLSSSGTSFQPMFEIGFWRIHKTLWEDKDLFIQNSPIFNADQVNTPLLMFHTTVDGVCPISQALEFYLALRRLGKRTWLLEYKDGDHYVSDKSAVDFTIRMDQFFDHYLKSKPAPIWMLNGIAAKDRRWNKALELDSQGKTPQLAPLQK